MSFNSTNIYNKKEFRSAHSLKYFFLSTGQRNIVKAIQFSFVERYEDWDVYNLGFGDYNIEEDRVDDSVSTNNNDCRMVLNTVLSAIPEFFKYYSANILIVRGSDGRSPFLEECRKICKRKCGDKCRKFNQRMRIYQQYVDLHYEELTKEYRFLGEYKNAEDQIFREKYRKGRSYISVLLIKKFR